MEAHGVWCTRFLPSKKVTRYGKITSLYTRYFVLIVNVCNLSMNLISERNVCNTFLSLIKFIERLQTLTCMPQTMNYVTLAIHVSKMMVSTSHAIYETLLWAWKFSIHLIDSITILRVSSAMIFSAKCTLPWHPLLEACHRGNTWSIYHRPTWRLLQIKDHVTLDIHVSSWMRVSTSSLHKFS